MVARFPSVRRTALARRRGNRAHLRFGRALPRAWPGRVHDLCRSLRSRCRPRRPRRSCARRGRPRHPLRPPGRTDRRPGSALRVLSGSRPGPAEGRAAAVLSLGTLAAGFAFALLLHLVLAYPTGRLGSRGTRALSSPSTWSCPLRDWPGAVPRSFFDPNCWQNCTDNVFRALARENRPRDPRCRPLVRRGCCASVLGIDASGGWPPRAPPPPDARGPVLSSGIALRGDARVPSSSTDPRREPE